MLQRINILLEKKWLPVSFRVITFIAFIGLVVIGFSSPTNNPFFLRQLSVINLTTSFVWRLWWPMIILSAIFLGRVWCMVCPVEMITTFFAKIGLRLKRPRWILSGWVITLFYAIIAIVGITILQIDTNPKYTASYLLIIMAISVVSGLIFEKNTFCRYICPVGYLLGIFSKMAGWGWRVKRKSVCEACTDKSCINTNYIYQLNYKSCGVDLVPAEINNNNYCILCAGCLKACKTYRTNSNSARPNPAIVKTGFANDLLQIKPLLVVEWFFLFFLSGHLIDEISEFRILSDNFFTFIPGNITDNLADANIGRGIIAAAYLFLFLPVIFWILPYILILSARMKISFGSYIKNFSQVFIPVIVALFIGLIVMEVGTRLPFYKYTLNDIKGIETTKAILFRQIEVPLLPLWTHWVFFFILIISLIIGIYVSFKVVRKLVIRFEIQKNKQILYMLPFIFIILFFIDVLSYPLFLNFLLK
jgi:polyferredoxin